MHHCAACCPAFRSSQASQASLGRRDEQERKALGYLAKLFGQALGLHVPIWGPANRLMSNGQKSFPNCALSAEEIGQLADSMLFRLRQLCLWIQRDVSTTHRPEHAPHPAALIALPPSSSLRPLRDLPPPTLVLSPLELPALQHRVREVRPAGVFTRHGAPSNGRGQPPPPSAAGRSLAACLWVWLVCQDEAAVARVELQRNMAADEVCQRGQRR